MDLFLVSSLFPKREEEEEEREKREREEERERERERAAMVEEYRVSATSVVKMVMHAAKYAHGEVTGLLLGHAEPSGTQPVMIEDVIPLFHKTESKTSPLLEVALAQVNK